MIKPMNYSIHHNNHFWFFRIAICLLAYLLVAASCSEEQPYEVAGEARRPVSINCSGIIGMQVGGLETKAQSLPDVVQTSFNNGDQLTLSYTLGGAPLTATATFNDSGWSIVDGSGNIFKLPADFKGDVTATTLTNDESGVPGYPKNILKATCSNPEYVDGKFTLSFFFEQATAGIQANVLILGNTAGAVELAYTEGSDLTTKYFEIGSTTLFTYNRFFDTDPAFKIVGFRVQKQDGNYKEKTFTATEILTLQKGTFYFLDIYIDDLTN